MLGDYFAFCREYGESYGYRGDIGSVGYLVNQDDNNLFSYSRDGRVVTIDPVSTGGREWDDFLDAFNEFCIDHGGVPLFNQTPRLTSSQADRALGPRIGEFQVIQRELDPHGRFENGFFKRLMAHESIAKT